MLPSAARLSLFFLAAGFALLSAAGCVAPALNDPARIGPFFTPKNHVGEPSLGGMRRVVLLPIWGGAIASVETTSELDAVFTAALQRENRFEVVTFSRQESLRRFHTEAISVASALPPDLLPMLKREFAADGVMFIDLTAYSAYRPLVLGLRAKLTTSDGSRLVWTFDDEFSANNPAVANSARHYSLDAREGIPTDLSPAVLQSPGRFAAYAASAMFATLPPVVALHPEKISGPPAATR